MNALKTRLNTRMKHMKEPLLSIHQVPTSLIDSNPVAQLPKGYSGSTILKTVPKRTATVCAGATWGNGWTRLKTCMAILWYHILEKDFPEKAAAHLAEGYIPGTKRVLVTSLAYISNGWTMQIGNLLYNCILVEFKSSLTSKSLHSASIALICKRESQQASERRAHRAPPNLLQRPCFLNQRSTSLLSGQLDLQ